MRENKAINPKHSGPVSTGGVLMPSRSAKIKAVVEGKGETIGGATDLETMTVYVPMEDNAGDRTIRSHEALHATCTAHRVPKDILDQALEDARLHYHCSNSVRSEFQQNRRDEIEAARADLKQMSKKEDSQLSAISNVVALRAMAILTKAGGKITPANSRLLNSQLKRLGKYAARDFSKAIELLADTSNWESARKVLEKYFVTDYKAPKPEPTEPGGDEPGGEPEPTKPRESEPTDHDGGYDDDSETGDGSHSESEESESGDDETTVGPGRVIAPVIPPHKPPVKQKAHVDAYTSDLCPEMDRKTFERLSERFPLELRIRRLDMGINRVRLSLGRKAPMPVMSGRRILANKLASAFVTPGVRCFARTVSEGLGGTILIDASGSMQIPEERLIEFLAHAPALTLGFYNAPSDSYQSSLAYGTIFVYAANGYRASIVTTALISGYAHGNMIDYQAIAWLLKQPMPRYLITDRGFTGPWADAAQSLLCRLEETRDVLVVRNLARMETILKGKRHAR
jgi:hypothetical protein